MFFLSIRGTGNGLEVFSSTCQTVLGSWRTCTPRETDSEKSSSLGKNSAAVSTLKPMLGASLPREPARVALAMAWRSSLALDRQFLALGGQKVCRKVWWKWVWNSHIFASQMSVFSRFSSCSDPLHDLGVFCDVFHSILGMWGSRIETKSLVIQKIASGTLIYFLCFAWLSLRKMLFWGFNLNLHATYQLFRAFQGPFCSVYVVKFRNLNPS